MPVVHEDVEAGYRMRRGTRGPGIASRRDDSVEEEGGLDATVVGGGVEAPLRNDAPVGQLVCRDNSAAEAAVC